VIPAPEAGRFTIGDFVLVFVGGLLGGILAAVPAMVIGDQEGLLVVSVVGQYLGHLVVLALILRRRRTSFAQMGLVVIPRDALWLLVGVVLQLGLAILFFPIAEALGPVEPTQSVTESVRRLTATPARLIMAGSLALLAPVTEELMFRGMLMSTLISRRGVRVGLLLTSVVFALFHLPGSTGNLLRVAAILMPILVIVGWLLGAITVRLRGRLGPSIFVHAGYNLVALASLLIPEEMLDRLAGG
jgi:membrane protease YdiL (CAAX protease family)